MRAIAFRDFGLPPAPEDLPTPQPGPGEVLVRVRNASLNGFDLGVLGGYMKGMMEHDFPVVLGKDFAGEISAVGPGVGEFAVGDGVFGVVMHPVLGPGSLAEHVVVNAAYGIARLPEDLPYDSAAALALAGTAALDAVDALAPKAGETVLLVGATGGVGGYAVQLAAARGCTVIATAEPGPQAAFVRALGATHTVVPSALVEQVRALAPDGVDTALHLVGDGDTVADLVAPGGRLASTLFYTASPDRAVTSTAITANPTSQTLARLAAETVAGRLRVPVAATHPLAEAPRAIADFATGTVGKIVIEI